jgi:DNA-binding transcriptional LysR family regulator
MRDLNELEILDRIASRLSLDAAARDLDLSPSTVSRKLAALEKRLGIALVHRTTRAVRLTPAGQAYAERCRAVCAAADQADAVVASLKEQFSGELSVNAPALFGRLVLAPTLFAFAQRHPAVQIRLTLTNVYVDPVTAGADIVFRTGHLSDSRLRARKLGDADMVIVASPSCVAAHGLPTTLAEVAELPCLVFGVVGSRWKCGGAEGLEVRTALAIDDLELLRDAAAAGLGFALLPTFLAAPLLARGHLRQLDLAEDLGSNPVYAVYPSHDIPNPCARALTEDVAAALARDANWRAASGLDGPISSTLVRTGDALIDLNSPNLLSRRPKGTP